MSLIKKVQNTIFQHNLLNRGDKIILAVSGGPDSVSMFDIFSKLQKKYDLKLIIAHVNYGLRGKDSVKDEEFVKNLAEKHGLKVMTLSPLRTRKSLVSENELRDIRYAFFEKIRTQKKYDAIAVAHTLDDQAETYLMRVLRGAGLLGLSAMKYRNKNTIRPLLGITRKEIFDYLKKNKLAWRLDKTNLGKTYLRNKIRNELIPYLEKNYNPKIKKTLSDSAAAIAEDYNYLAAAAEKKLKNLFPLRISGIKKLHPAILRRVILAAILEKNKDLKNIKFTNVEEIIKIIKSSKNKPQIATFRGLKVTRRGDKLEISRIM